MSVSPIASFLLVYIIGVCALSTQCSRVIQPKVHPELGKEACLLIFNGG